MKNLSDEAVHGHKEFWPTPGASDSKQRCSNNSMAKKRKETSKQIGLETAIYLKNQFCEGNKTGALNPDWVELLMGLPPGWTDVTAESMGEVRPWDENWESGVQRVTNIHKNRVDRIRLLGNGVVPQTAAKAWQVLDNELSGKVRRERQLDFAF